nr:hypothetical protein [uncultured Caldimonas sp.]
MKALTSALLAFSVLLGGCAASVKTGTADNNPLRVPVSATKNVVLNVTGSSTATSSKDWAQFKQEWHEAMQTAVAQSGAKLSFQDGTPRHTGDTGTLVVVNVNDYRYVSAGARFGLGVMTGNAFIDAKVRFADLRNGTDFGERSYNTSSSAWEGIFSAMTSKQIEAVCQQIAGELKLR